MKLDTEGFDIDILFDSLNWLETNKCGIVFENHVQDLKGLQRSQAILTRLRDIGYKCYTIWDDPGTHMLSTKSIQAVTDLCNYVLLNCSGKTPRRIYYTDILCLHKRDVDIFEAIHNDSMAKLHIY